MSPIPATRKAALDAFPLIVDVLEDRDTKALFSRQFLTSQLGGSVQRVFAKYIFIHTKKKPNTDTRHLSVDVSKRRPLARHGISCYLCPNLEQNPWCPTQPGMHGYMFVGLGTDAGTFVKPATRDIFVSIGTKKSRYLGLYEASRVDKLTVNEWTAFPDSVCVQVLPCYCAQFTCHL